MAVTVTADDSLECNPMPLTAKSIYEALIAGEPASKLQRYVELLPSEERQDLFRVLWCMRDEVAESCYPRAIEMDHIVENNSPFLSHAAVGFASGY